MKSGKRTKSLELTQTPGGSGGIRICLFIRVWLWNAGAMSSSAGGEYSDRAVLLRSNSSNSDPDLERGSVQSSNRNSNTSNKGNYASDLLKRLDRGLTGSGRRLSVKLRPDHRLSSSIPSPSDHVGSAGSAGADDFLGDGAPPEWALLLIGCLLGVASGLCVAAFNRGVSL